MLSKHIFAVAETLHHYSKLHSNFTAKFDDFVSLSLSLFVEDSIIKTDETQFFMQREKVKISLVFQFDQFTYTFGCWLKVRSRHVGKHEANP